MSRPATTPLCSPATQHCLEPFLAEHHQAFTGERELQGVGVGMGTATGEVSSSAWPERQSALCAMQKIHPASQSSARLKLPFFLTVT